MIRLQILILLAILSITFSAFGADWSVGWTGADGRQGFQKLADDQEFWFKLRKFDCKVSKTTLEKISNEVFERRYLSCSISRDTTVSVDLSYNVGSKDYIDGRSLIFDNYDKRFMATLLVRQKRD